MYNPITKRRRVAKHRGPLKRIPPSCIDALRKGEKMFGTQSRLGKYLEYDASGIRAILNGTQLDAHSETVQKFCRFRDALKAGNVRCILPGIPNGPRKKPVIAYSPRPESPEQMAGLTDRMRSQVRHIVQTCLETSAPTDREERDRTIAALQGDLAREMNANKRLRAKLKAVYYALAE